MKLKEQARLANDKLKNYDGIDPVKARELQKAQEDAAAAAQEAERKRLLETGQFEAVKKQMVDQHTSEITKRDEAVKAANDALAAAQATISELTVGTAFSNSKYIADELHLTPRKVRALYGSHAAFEDGKVVVYDKPAGAKDRAPLVDAKGDPLAFDAAIAKLVEADEDRDSMKKSKMKPGSGSTTTTATTTTAANEPAATEGGLSKIQAALRAQAAKK
jgi:hypothetical protein